MLEYSDVGGGFAFASGRVGEQITGCYIQGLKRWDEGRWPKGYLF